MYKRKISNCKNFTVVKSVLAFSKVRNYFKSWNYILTLWNVNFGTLMYDGHFICLWSQWLVFRLVIQIQCIWNVNDWYINNSRSIHYLQFLLLISGFYLFSIQYQTKNCGALALCGPTIVDMYQDGGVIRSFERNLAIDNKADTDMVNLETQ